MNTVHSKMKGIARLFHFSPFDMQNMYLDRVDHLGIDFWFDDAIAYDKEVKSSITPKK